MPEPKRVRVVSPCTESGARFEERDGGARFCVHCRELTHDLREATRSQARALFQKNGGKLCAQVRVGVGGEVQFRPEPPARGRSALGGAALALALAGCDGEPASMPMEITPTREATSSPATTTPSPTPPSPTPAPPTAPEPASAVGSAVEASPEPAPPEDEPDHSTDASPTLEHHRGHRHRHRPVQHDEGVLVGGLDGL